VRIITLPLLDQRRRRRTRKGGRKGRRKGDSTNITLLRERTRK